MPTPGLSALAARVALLVATGPDHGPIVQVVGCPDLSSDRIAEHLVVEHPEFRTTGAPRIELTCHERTVEIVVRDAAGSRQVRRTVQAAPEGPHGRDRQVALATSSLIVASRTAAEAPTPASQDEPGALDAGEGESVRTAPLVAIQATAAIRVRDLGRGLLVSHAGLRAGWLAGRGLEVFGQASVEYGQARRDRGQVDAFAAFAGPGVAWTLRPEERVGLEVWAAALAGYARLAGRTVMPGVDPGVIGGITGEAELGFGPKFRAGAFVMVLDLRAGYALPTPRGNVAGEARVQYGGFWTGIGLRAGGLLRGK